MHWAIFWAIFSKTHLVTKPSNLTLNIIKRSVLSFSEYRFFHRRMLFITKLFGQNFSDKTFRTKLLRTKRFGQNFSDKKRARRSVGGRLLFDSNQNIQRFLYSAKSVTSLVTANDLFDTRRRRGGHCSVWAVMHMYLCM
jgi:hypothetical protein